MAILLENDHPSTPLVNAGAISADSMVKPVGNSEAKWKAITDNMRELSGSDLKLLDELYKSESETNFNNRSIAWLLKNFNRIYDDPDTSARPVHPAMLDGCNGKTIIHRRLHDCQ